jgi:hyperosmotically inducible protein
MTNSRNAVLSACVALALVASPVWAAESVGMAVDDTMVTTKVKAALIENPATKAHQINVETKAGMVQLNGFVDSANEKMAAESAAKKVAGVKGVDNNLQVKSGETTVGSVVDDSVITTKVKAALIGDSRTKARDITVKTNKGVVVLGGTVDTEMEKTAAGMLAKNVAGVTRVENGILLGKQ